MTYSTPVLTDRVPYSWDELKAHAVDTKFAKAEADSEPTPRQASVVPDAPVRTAAAFAPAPVRMKQDSHKAISQTNEAPVAAMPDKAKLVEEIVSEVVPLIMERLHGQVSILVDMTMKQAAGKIRHDFDNALKSTVQSAVQKVVEQKLR